MDVNESSLVVRLNESLQLHCIACKSLEEANYCLLSKHATAETRNVKKKKKYYSIFIMEDTNIRRILYCILPQDEEIMPYTGFETNGDVAFEDLYYHGKHKDLKIFHIHV